MATQLLIYETAVPITQGRHGTWSVEVGADYAFSRHVNSVPLMAVEFSHAAPEYAIVFAGTDEAVMPAVILGMRGSENLYLTPQGAWRAKYIPAFVRRYPFVFSSSDDGTRFTLCVDEVFGGFNQAGRGERLFVDQGKPTPYVERVLAFLQEYQAQFGRTQAFCRTLKGLDLLEPMQAQVTLGSGERLSLTGFQAVNRDRLKKLSGDTLAQLAKTDELELVYLHLQSMRNFAGMPERLAGSPAAAAPASPQPNTAADPTSAGEIDKERRGSPRRASRGSRHAV